MFSAGALPVRTVEPPDSCSLLGATHSASYKIPSEADCSAELLTSSGAHSTGPIDDPYNADISPTVPYSGKGVSVANVPGRELIIR